MIEVFNEAVGQAECRDLLQRARELAPTCGIAQFGPASHSGVRRYTLLDGQVMRKHFRDLLLWYRAIAMWASVLCRRPVVVSPYIRSSVNIKIYEEPGSCQGWHYDTNPLTVVLYLMDAEAPTVFQTEGGETKVDAREGRVLMFSGRHILHQVAPTDDARAIVVCNLYHPDDLDRPDWIDPMEYGEARDG